MLHPQDCSEAQVYLADHFDPAFSSQKCVAQANLQFIPTTDGPTLLTIEADATVLTLPIQFCPFCGQKLEGATRGVSLATVCDFCGTENHICLTNIHCSDCGHLLDIDREIRRRLAGRD